MRAFRLIPLLIAAGLPFAARAQDAAEQTVVAEGMGAAANDPAAARERALDNALRRAVEQAVGTMIESQTATDNYELLDDRIYSQARGFVKSYKILSEKTDADSGAVRIKVEAVVSTGKVTGELGALKLLQRRMKMPRVVVAVSEKTWDHAAWWWGREGVSEAETAVIRVLREKGFTVLDSRALKQAAGMLAEASGADGEPDSLIAAGRKAGAEVIIFGQAELQDEGAIRGSALHSYAGHLTLRAVKADTGESLGTATGARKTANISGTGAMPEIYRGMATAATGSLVDEIAQKWSDELTGSRMVMLTVSGLDAATAEKLRGALAKNARGAAGVTLRAFSGSTAEYQVDFRGDAEDLARELPKAAVPGCALSITKQTQNTLAAQCR